MKESLRPVGFAELLNTGDASGMSKPPEPGPGPTLYRVEDGVATITLNMADQKNSLSNELVTSLGRNLESAYQDGSVRVVVLTNSGNTFCAGADLKAIEPGVPIPKNQETHLSFVDVFNLILDGPKPVLGKINGHAMGGGVGLVAVCDISVMRDDAKIGFTEVRLGVAPAIISVVCLPKMSRADAMELFLTGERFSPQRAVDIGLINRCTSADNLDITIDAFIKAICKGGPLALAATKSIVRRVPTMDRETAFEAMSFESQTLFQSDEASAGMAAFRQRQPAPWA